MAVFITLAHKWMAKLNQRRWFVKQLEGAYTELSTCDHLF